jgi:type III secretory pathway lipoprotein EscJ
MKKIVVIALAAVCLFGCKQEKQELHDPLLRQQLTTMISTLDEQNVKAADQAGKDLQAILSVNRGKFSKEQKDKLISAMTILEQSTVNFYSREIDHAADPKKPEASLDNISDVKKELSELAATF